MKSTTDIWIAAFCLLKGHELRRFEVSDSKRVRYFFDLTEEEWQRLRIEFSNSELSKYKIAIEQVKDLAY